MQQKDLLEAIENKSPQEVAALIASGGLPTTKFGGIEYLDAAIQRDQPEMLEALFAAGLSRDAPDPIEGRTPLMRAVEFGKVKSIKHLIGCGADMNVRSHYGDALIHRAVAVGGRAAIKAVLAAGADIETPDKKGLRPLHLACDLGKGPAVAELLAAKADVNAPGANGRTPLHEAVSDKQKSRLAIVQALLAAGADVEGLDGHGSTAFQTAALQGASVEVMEALLAAGADPKRKDSLGEDPLDKATRFGQKHLIPILTKHCRGE